ncbi:MAG: hypothetical protein OYK82_10305 [Gammaproteobacteria bacterium]|nr:hypothetical protein [Gammaproteobacteria bacterium]
MLSRASGPDELAGEARALRGTYVLVVSSPDPDGAGISGSGWGYLCRRTE